MPAPDPLGDHSGFSLGNKDVRIVPIGGGDFKVALTGPGGTEPVLFIQFSGADAVFNSLVDAGQMAEDAAGSLGFARPLF